MSAHSLVLMTVDKEVCPPCRAAACIVNIKGMHFCDSAVRWVGFFPSSFWRLTIARRKGVRCLYSSVWFRDTLKLVKEKSISLIKPLGIVLHGHLLFWYLHWFWKEKIGTKWFIF